MLEIGIVGKASIKAFTEIIYQLVGKSSSYMTPLWVMKASHNGVNVEQMDQTAAVFTVININRSFFSRFDFTDDLPEALFKFNAKALVDNLRKLTSDVEAVDFIFDKKYLNVIFTSAAGAAASYRLDLYTFDDDDRRDIGEKAGSLPLNTEIKLYEDELSKFVSVYKNAQIYDKSQKHLAFEVNNIGGSGLLSLSAYQEGSKVETKSVFDHVAQSDDEEIVKSKYDDEFLNKFLALVTNKTSFARLRHLFKEIMFELSSNGPLRITLDLDSIDIMFLMAPLETEDEDFEEEDELELTT